MTKREYKEKLFAVLCQPIEGINFDEQITYVEKLLIDFQKENEIREIPATREKSGRMSNLKLFCQMRHPPATV